MTDQQLLERRVRETLATRADGVAATPALYERVQRGIRRDRRVGMARAWAMLATIVVLAGLVVVALPSDEVGVDVVEDPSDTVRDDGRTDEDADGGIDTALPSDLPFGGVGYAMQDDDGLTLFAPDGSSLLEVPASEGRAVDLAVPADWSAADGVLAAFVGVPEESDAQLHLYGMGYGQVMWSDHVDRVGVNGGHVAMVPDGSAVLWIEADRLAILDIAAGGPAADAPRYFDLSPTNVPDVLAAEQVVRNDDGQLILFATDPVANEAWSLPLTTDVTGAVGPADASLSPPGEVPPTITTLPGPVPGLGTVLDVVSLPDGSMLSLEASVDGGDTPFLRRTTFGAQDQDLIQPLPDLPWPNTALELDSGGGWQVTLHDGERGIVHRYLIDPVARTDEEPFATSRGADAATAGVHVGADAAAWGGGGDSQDELAALMEQELRQQLAEARAAAEARRTEAVAERGLLTGVGRSYRVEDGRIVSSGGNKPDLGADPFPDEAVELGLLAANPAGSVSPETLTDLVVEVDRGTNRDLHLVAYTDGGNVQGPDGRTDAPAGVTVAPLSLGVDGPLTGLVRSPDGGWVAWTTSATLGLAEVSQDGLEIAAAIDVPTDLPLVDWVWEEPGHVAELGFAAPGRGTQEMTVDLDADDGILMRSPETVSPTEARVRVVDLSGGVAGAVVLPASLDRVQWGPGGERATPPVWRAGEPSMRLTQGPGGVLVTIGSAAWMIDLDADLDRRADDAPTIRELPSGTRAIG